MFTLIFNTTQKTARVSYYENGCLTEHKYENITTVKTDNGTPSYSGNPMGYYELMQKEGDKTRPVLRVPVSNTIMFIDC